VEAFLHAQDVQGELVHLAEHTPTVEDAARVMGTGVDGIVKSVLFLWDAPEAAGQQAVLVIANGTRRVDYRRVADCLGVSRRRVRLANAETVQAVTGYSVGAVPPFAYPRPLRTLIDQRVLEQTQVYAGGGALDALLRIAPAEIARITRAEVVDVVA
jgi:prolyl-tRNA editing enzyme YbaK/EbsC (Cys-tRNA(Pro) deacylase)